MIHNHSFHLSLSLQCAFVLVSLLMLCFRAISASRILQEVKLSTSARTLKDGQACSLSADRNWTPPFCAGGPLNCIIKKLPSSNSNLLTGKCNSTFNRGSYCSVGPFRFAVGVKKIPNYGPSSCETCSCKRHKSLKTRNQATCDCDPLPACYLHLNGKVLSGHGCPYQTQSQCVIVKTLGGKVVNGKKTHLGRCQAPQVGYCVSAGPTWGPFFYAKGTKNVPRPGNRCFACRCRRDFSIGSCKAILGCKTP